MTITEEHALVRSFLRRLGSSHVYVEDVLAGTYSHQPVRIVIGRQARPLGAPHGGPETPPTNRPSALAFALTAPTSPVGTPAPAPGDPGPAPVTVELVRVSAPSPAPPMVSDSVQGVSALLLADSQAASQVAQSSKPTASPAPARLLVDDLESRGHRVLTRDGKLFISNASQLTTEDRTAIQALKPELISIADPWPVPRETSLAVFLGNTPPAPASEWQALPPPENLPHDIILNFETNGLDWVHGDEPVGVTIGTFDGLRRYLPFAHRGGGNLDREVVIRYLQTEIRGKHIKNANTRFEVHMGKNINVDFEAQGCTVSDIMHTAALLDDHRRKFALDVLAKDYLGGVEVERVDERNMADYAAADVARRAEYQAELVARLHEVMWPQVIEQELEKVHKIENDVIYAVCEMERNGSLLDLELLEQYHAECLKRHDELMWEVTHELGFPFEHTATGWKRLLEHYSLPVPDSFAENVLNGYDHPLVRKAQRASQYASLNSKTFAAYKKNIGPDGILRYDINQLRGDDGGTVSGRFSIGYVQQVPNHDNHHAAFGEGDADACKGQCPLFPRRIFIAADGADYLESDAMQIEYRLFAHFAQNQEVLRAYAEDPLMSFHKKMWAMVKQYKPDMLYTHQKNFDFAKQYGAKIVKLAVMLGFITDREATEIRAQKAWNDPKLALIKEIDRAFGQAMPEVDLLLDKASHLAKTMCDDYCRRGDALHRQFKHRGYVKTITGRRSRFPDNYKTYIGLNRVLQGSGADIMKVKLAELHRERKQTGFLMRLTVHDAVGGDARMLETKKMVSEILNTQSFPELRVPILWSVNTGRSWADCK